MVPLGIVCGTPGCNGTQFNNWLRHLKVSPKRPNQSDNRHLEDYIRNEKFTHQFLLILFCRRKYVLSLLTARNTIFSRSQICCRIPWDERSLVLWWSHPMPTVSFLLSGQVTASPLLSVFCLLSGRGGVISHHLTSWLCELSFVLVCPEKQEQKTLWWGHLMQLNLTLPNLPSTNLTKPYLSLPNVTLSNLTWPYQTLPNLAKPVRIT